MEPTKITVQTTVNAPLAETWNSWTTPEDITKWNAASEDWHTTQAENDPKTGGVFLPEWRRKMAVWDLISKVFMTW